MKDIGFLNNLKIEVKDAKNGVGKPILEVEKLCNTVYRLLSTLEDKMEVTFYIGIEGLYRIVDIEIDPSDKSIFEEIIYELNKKHIIGHKRDFPIKRNNVFQDTVYFKEMIDGKNLVMKRKKEFRQYVDLVRKIVDGIHEQGDKEKKNESKVEKNKNGQVDELVVGPLVYGIDGGIYFKGKLIKMRSQIETLCILFMNHHKKLLGYDTIKDELIDPTKPREKGFKTTTKYVSELHALLKKYFNKKVIFNHEKHSYIFDTERKFIKLNKK